MVELVKLDREQALRFLTGISDVNAGLMKMARALTISEEVDRQLFDEVMILQASCDALVSRLQPAVFFENDTSVD